jgi:valyl-tRNA synthetase
VKAIELETSYNPKDFEDRLYDMWKHSGSFAPKAESSESTYTIVMPPPNVTGILHMGHALNNLLPDILIRYHRMRGARTLWLPGTDHAGIATQNVVERELKQEGLTRQDVGREAFVAKTWEVKERHHTTIVKQLEKIGCSCDWSRERFTLDEGLSEAVREAFVRLYEKGLIYKGNYLVNYCPHCGTALADDEVEYQQTDGKLYNIDYPLEDGSGVITVATTRPETMFGDVAVAVHPEDERFTHLVGKKVLLPLTGRYIPIIADEYVNMEFGTGFVKITPAHDPNDWEVGQRHNLEMPNILNADGSLNEHVPPEFQHLDIITARKAVVKALTEGGYLSKVAEHNHEVGHCYRCFTTIEPYLSEQWFVSMKEMANKALNAWKEGELSFYAKRWENTYSHWLSNIRDWCISRQLWWGHRIPVWYCQECGNMMVERVDPTVCSSCSSTNIVQDEDVLDTWFSSWLWPFSTLGWPHETEDLKTFFPTQTLLTGYDIIFFWVSRMIMASLEFLGEVPFKDIYITGLVRDKQGRKMSKSLGNGIDPLEVVDVYGADAMKFTLAYLAAQGQDILIDMESFKLGSRFANKIWNATRFLLMNLEGKTLVEIKEEDLSLIDRWMYHQLNEAVLAIDKALESYRFNEAAQIVYDLFWSDFCDWYIEATKINLNSFDTKRVNIQVSVTLDILERLMRLMHPFVSFITEEIYQKLPNTTAHVIDAPYPRYQKTLVDVHAKEVIDSMQSLIHSVRSLRSELHIRAEVKLDVTVRVDDQFVATAFLQEHRKMIATFMGAKELIIDLDQGHSIAHGVPVAISHAEAFVFVSEAIDVESEIKRVRGELENNEKLLASTLKKLSNEKFLANAKEIAIEKEKSKQAEFEEKIAKATNHIELLQTLR